MRKLLVACLLFVVMMSVRVYAEEALAPPENIPGAMIVNAEEVIKLIFSNPNLIMIDSRKETEFVKGHIEGAINILNTQLDEKKLEQVAADKTAAVLFYCNGERCLRSADAVNKAIGWGYSNVFWFRGGWKEWSEKRFPVVSGD